MEVLFGDLLSDCNTSKLHQVLLKIKSDSNPVISSASLKLLKRLWLDSSLQQQFNVSLLYIHLIKIGLQFPVPLLISLANDSLQLSEQLRGSEISDTIDYRVFRSFTKLKKTKSLTTSESYSIDQLLFKYQDESVQGKISEISERIMENDLSAMQDFTNLLCSFSSTRKLFNSIEKDIDVLVSSFKSVKSLQIFVQILNFLNNFLMDRFYLIDHKLYSPSYLKYYQVHTKVFKVLWKVVLNFAQADIVVSQNLMKIIPKFWNVFTEQRGKMLPDIVLLIKDISRAQYVDNNLLCEKFLYEVFADAKVDNGIKSYLKSELNDFFLSKSFKYQPRSSSFLESLKINHGYPLLSQIEAGEKLVLKYQVQLKSLFYCAFVLDSHDIEYSIILHSGDTQTTLFSDKYSASPNPVEHRFCIQSKGIVTVEFNNSYSWLNSKSIRYRVLVLNPVGSCNDQDIDPAFAILDEHHLVLFCKDKRIEHFSPEDPQRTIIDYMSKYNKKSINLVSSTEFNSNFGEFTDILCASDIETAAKVVWQKKGVEMILVVSNTPAPRFTLMLKGKTVRTASGKGIAEDFGDMVLALVKVFKGKVFLFRVSDSENVKRRFGDIGLEVEDLDMEVEDMVVNLKSILCNG